MNSFQRRRFGALALSLAAAGLATFGLPASAHVHDGDGFLSGMVFTSTNAVSGNELLVYARNADDTLSLATRLLTGGDGSGAGLGTQGAVTLARDGRHLFVVNAQSNTVSTFVLGRRGVQLASVVASGGLHPVSATEHDGVVYVLNDGGAGNVAGLRNVGGVLQPIAGSARGLSVAGGAGPAQVGFSDDGDALVVTEKNTNKLTSWRVNADASLGAPVVTASPGLTPFGFAFNRRNKLVVTEAAGGAPGAASVSSYRFGAADPARPVAASVSVADTQTSACWIAVTPDGRHAYAANTGASSVSSFRLLAGGKIELAAAVAAPTGSGSSPADTAISADGRHLFVRNGGTFTLAAWRIEPDGTLLAPTSQGGLPSTAVGLAAN